ncbi:MAG: pyroglutamyl-peptidase I [Betaproteobacteria bacterium]|nr:pyroglutamyl-peptidase I [Betaproteobacteria bacterium]
MKAKALVTGFDAFGGDVINPSYEAVRRLPARIGTLGIVTARLPTSFARAPRQLEGLIARERPDIVVCVGLAAQRDAIGIERVAVNLQHACMADNDGQQPQDQPIVARGPAAYFSTLPVITIVDALNRAGLHAQMSMSAGTFVCNQVFYRLMHGAAARRAGRHIRHAGFVHVPALPVAGTEAALARLARALAVTLTVIQRSGGVVAKSKGNAG